MPQSKRQTNDVDERLKFKSRIKTKLAEALTPHTAPVVEKTILRLPVNYEKLPEPDLLFTLTHNPELQHSTESAALAVNMLFGRASNANIQFELIELSNPVEVPEFIKAGPAPRKPSKTAPGFARSVDSLPERMAKEVVKKQQFKQSLADKVQQKVTEKVTFINQEPRVLRLPANYQELSEADLHFALVNSPELKHSHDTALLAIEMVKGKQVRNTHLQLTDFIAERVIPKVEKRAISKPTKPRAKDVTSNPLEGDKVLLLPPNYRELSESSLAAELSHNKELKYTPEEVYYILDVLFNRIPEPEGVSFAVYEPTPPENAQTPKLQEPREVLELKVPANYRDFSSVDLHTILLNTPELEHNEETALLTLKIITGGARPTNAVLQTIDVTPVLPVDEPEEQPVPPDDSETELPKEVLTGEAEFVKPLPNNYRELPEAALFKLLKNHSEFKHTNKEVYDTLDIVFGRKEQPENMRFELIEYVEEVEPLTDEPYPKEQRLVRNTDGQLRWV